jgi:hypothetical protein
VDEIDRIDQPGLRRESCGKATSSSDSSTTFCRHACIATLAFARQLQREELQEDRRTTVLYLLGDSTLHVDWLVIPATCVHLGFELK